jgi:hypothetical protein
MKPGIVEYCFNVFEQPDDVERTGIVIYSGSIEAVFCSEDCEDTEMNTETIGEFQITRIQNTFEGTPFSLIADDYSQEASDVYATFFDDDSRDLKKPYRNELCAHEFYILTRLKIVRRVDRLHVIERVLSHFIRYHCTYGSFFVAPDGFINAAEAKVLKMKKARDWRYVFRETLILPAGKEDVE